MFYSSCTLTWHSINSGSAQCFSPLIDTHTHTRAAYQWQWQRSEGHPHSSRRSIIANKILKINLTRLSLATNSEKRQKRTTDRADGGSGTPLCSSSGGGSSRTLVARTENETHGAHTMIYNFALRVFSFLLPNFGRGRPPSAACVNSHSQSHSCQTAYSIVRCRAGECLSSIPFPNALHFSYFMRAWFRLKLLNSMLHNVWKAHTTLLAPWSPETEYRTREQNDKKRKENKSFPFVQVLEENGWMANKKFAFFAWAEWHKIARIANYVKEWTAHRTHPQDTDGRDELLAVVRRDCDDDADDERRQRHVIKILMSSHLIIFPLSLAAAFCQHSALNVRSQLAQSHKIFIF